MRTAAIAKVSKRGSRPTGESPASATLKTDWAERSNGHHSRPNRFAAGKNGTPPGSLPDPSPPIGDRLFHPSIQTSNGKTGLVQPRIVRRLTS
jgi:hypothetical protein